MIANAPLPIRLRVMLGGFPVEGEDFTGVGELMYAPAGGDFTAALGYVVEEATQGGYYWYFPHQTEVTSALSGFSIKVLPPGGTAPDDEYEVEITDIDAEVYGAYAFAEIPLSGIYTGESLWARYRKIGTRGNGRTLQFAMDSLLNDGELTDGADAVFHYKEDETDVADLLAALAGSEFHALTSKGSGGVLSDRVTNGQIVTYADGLDSALASASVWRDQPGNYDSSIYPADSITFGGSPLFHKLGPGPIASPIGAAQPILVELNGGYSALSIASVAPDGTNTWLTEGVDYAVSAYGFWFFLTDLVLATAGPWKIYVYAEYDGDPLKWGQWTQLVNVAAATADVNLVTVQGDLINNLVAGNMPSHVVDIDDSVINETTFQDDAISPRVLEDATLELSKFADDAKAALFGYVEIPPAAGGTFTRTRVDLDVGSSSTLDNYYNGALVYVVGGTGVGGWAVVDGYTNGGTVHTLALAGDGLQVAPAEDSVLAILRAGRYLTGDAVRDLIEGQASIVEGSDTLGDTLRLHSSILAGIVDDFRTGVLAFKSLDGSKTRRTVNTAASGRTASTPGDLTP